MVDKLLLAYDHYLTETLQDSGLVRFRRGIYVRSKNDTIWAGLWVTFNIRKGIVLAQPNISFFCPTAEKIVSDSLSTIYGKYHFKSTLGILRSPILTRPLYSIVRSVTGEDRVPSCYYLDSLDKAIIIANLIKNDYERAGRHFIDEIDSMKKLRDYIINDTGAGARMYAISMSYLMDKNITPDKIDKMLGVQPNAMSREFADFFKKLIKLTA